MDSNNGTTVAELAVSAVVSAPRELFRYLFYVEPPSNIVQKLEEVPDYTGNAIPYFLLLIFIELVVGFVRGVKDLYRVNDFVASLNLGLLMMVIHLLFDALCVSLFCFIYENFRVVELPHDSVWTYLCLFLGVDFAYYWLHRCSHTYHFMWSAHSVHHSGEDYNLATALRQGSLQYPLTLPFSLPLPLFFHPAAIMSHKHLNTLAQFWIHTSVVGRLGWLEYVVNTPSSHRMHHRPPGNCNYAGVLIIWDRMFGTYVPEDEHRDYYGLAKQYSTFDPLAANIEHIKRVLANVRHASQKHAILNLFKTRVNHKPIFEPLKLFKAIPSKPELWNIPTTPKREKYNGRDWTSRHVIGQVYVLVGLAVFVPQLLFCCAKIRELELLGRGVTMLYLLLSLSASGRLSDSMTGVGAILETARIAILLYVVFTQNTGLPVDPAVPQGIALFWTAFWAISFVSLRFIATSPEKQAKTTGKKNT